MTDYDSGFNVAAPYTTATPVDDTVAATLANSFQSPASQSAHVPSIGARSMTQPVNDPWAAAAAPAQQSTRQEPASGYGNPDDSASSLSEGYAPEPEKQSSLFGGQEFDTLPGLFTANHAPGSKIKGKILAKPRDVQSTCHPNAAPDGVSRLKQYWVTQPGTSKRKPGLTPVDPQTGKPNDPVMNLVVAMQTGERDPQIEGDDGRRSWWIQGSAKAPEGHKIGDPVKSARLALLDALKLAAAQGLAIRSDADLVGKFVEVHRVRREQPNVSTSSWFWQARISNS